MQGPNRTARGIVLTLCTGFFTLLAMAAGSASAGEVITYFHNDVAGSPVLATDVNGNQVWKETYRPYGDRLVQSAASQNNDLWFTGKPYDEGIGLSYMGARYYDPVVGRFMGVDPVAIDASNVHSLNRYAYANNNPNKFVDPTGESAALAVLSVPPLLAAGCAAFDSCRNAVANLDWAKITAPITHPVLWSEEAKVADEESATQADGGNEESAKGTSTLKPGPYAGDSIPARGPERDFTPEEREKTNEIGADTGCHTCGTKDPGTKSGNFVPDHQPTNGTNPAGKPQRLYPHCLRCSLKQGGQVRQKVGRQQPKKPRGGQSQ